MCASKESWMYVCEDIIVFILGMTIVFMVWMIWSRRRRKSFQLRPIQSETIVTDWATENSYLTQEQWIKIRDYGLIKRII